MAAKKEGLFSLGSALDNDTGWSFEKEQPASKPAETKPPQKHLLVLKMEKRQGKPVSLVGPFLMENEALKSLCSLLKKKLGSGGTCKNEWLEFQGECREKLKTLLQTEGYRFKA
jgi:translation initiation factor 1